LAVSLSVAIGEVAQVHHDQLCHAPIANTTGIIPKTYNHLGTDLLDLLDLMDLLDLLIAQYVIVWQGVRLEGKAIQ
jgi:hypothetical protein